MTAAAPLPVEKQHDDKAPDKHKKVDQGIISKLPPSDQIKGKKDIPAVPPPAVDANIPPPASKQDVAPLPAQGGEDGMIELGGSLPALPPRPPVPQRQAIPSASSTYPNALPQRVPQLKQASKPQLNIPPGSDLGAVGKLGVYQMSHKSSAAGIHANMFFWVYLITFFVTFVLIKRK